MSRKHNKVRKRPTAPESGFWRGGNLSLKPQGSGTSSFFAARQVQWEHSNRLSHHYKNLARIKSDLTHLQQKKSRKHNVSPRIKTYRRVMLPKVDTFVFPNAQDAPILEKCQVRNEPIPRKKNGHARLNRNSKNKNKRRTDKRAFNFSPRPPHSRQEPHYLKETTSTMRRVHEIKKLPPIPLNKQPRNEFDILEKHDREEKDERLKIQRQKKRDLLAEKARERERMRQDAEEHSHQHDRDQSTKTTPVPRKVIHGKIPRVIKGYGAEKASEIRNEDTKKSSESQIMYTSDGLVVHSNIPEILDEVKVRKIVNSDSEDLLARDFHLSRGSEKIDNI